MLIIFDHFIASIIDELLQRILEFRRGMCIKKSLEIQAENSIVVFPGYLEIIHMTSSNPAISDDTSIHIYEYFGIMLEFIKCLRQNWTNSSLK